VTRTELSDQVELCDRALSSISQGDVPECGLFARVGVLIPMVPGLSIDPESVRQVTMAQRAVYVHLLECMLASEDE
jgi:hypothetical protein